MLALLALAALVVPFLGTPISVQGTDPADASQAEPVEEAESDPFDWVLGPGEGQLGDRAVVQVPEGLRFTGGDGTRTLLEAMENPTSGRELGLLASDAENWFVVFEFDEAGYVKDEDRGELDPDALLDVLREGNESGNEMRKQRGWEAIELVGWKKEPFYDQRTNNLTWATLLRSASGGESVNWSVRVLGRRGVMNVDLVLAPEQLDAALPKFEAVLDTFQYSDGERYAQFSAGDKVAEYGLAALVVGGGAAVAAKTGVLAKFWKFIVGGLVALGALGKKAWSWLTGRGKSEGEPEAR